MKTSITVDEIKNIFYNSLIHLTGFDGSKPLGTISVFNEKFSETGEKIAHIFKSFISQNYDLIDDKILKELKEAETIFIEYYSTNENSKILTNQWNEFINTEDEEKKAFILSSIFLPEITMNDSQIIDSWKLKEVNENPNPILPSEITIQLNALYSLPEKSDAKVPQKIIEKWNDIKHSNLTKIADYDHPVPLFTQNNNHELMKCLDEMENDILFEKSQNVISANSKVLITISISVTHSEIDEVATEWVEWLLKSRNYHNLSFLILSEKNINCIKKDILNYNPEIFSVFGKYAVHFNALKYSQLLLEKAFKIRAGFKLDTDEGMRSNDLFECTGKTWLQTLCHPLWGGSAKDCKENIVYLGINEGEYINGSDIDEFGYKDAYKLPEVKKPESFLSTSLTFAKRYTQAYVTELYNRFKNLNENISHPVVKGGGYGIDNEGLKKSGQFTLSLVGRAEDQAFYFYGLTKGVRGIFHPDLRIAHYKGSVQESEKKQAGTKFLGDMYRLIIFQHIVKILNIKNQIDPFPGIFAGEMARCQAFITTLYRALDFSTKGDDETAEFLINKGFDELNDLMTQIDSGKIDEKIVEEENLWREFIEVVDRLDSENVKDNLEKFII